LVGVTRGGGVGRGGVGEAGPGVEAAAEIGVAVVEARPAGRPAAGVVGTVVIHAAEAGLGGRRGEVYIVETDGERGQRRGGKERRREDGGDRDETARARAAAGGEDWAGHGVVCGSDRSASRRRIRKPDTVAMLSRFIFAMKEMSRSAQSQGDG
jgi:hypothetical protein